MNRATGSLTAQTLIRAFALGFACGLRLIVGFSMLAFFHGRNECARCAPGPLQSMRTDTGKALLGAASVGELVVDKLPLTTARIASAPLLGRVGFGAASGFLATKATPPGRDPSIAVLGALLGATGAGTGAFAGYFARTTATETSGLPDAPFAVIEDAVALGIGVCAARS